MAAARTPASYQRVSMGSTTLLLVRFTDVVTGDTWVSGLTDIVDYWMQARVATGTQASSGCNVAVSSGTFTFQPGFDTQASTLYVICGGPS